MLLRAPLIRCLPLLALVSSFASIVCAAEEPMAIVGWPTRPLDPQEPPAWLGDDPVIGRLACPPFSRLNLSKKRSEALIVQDPTVAKTPQGQVTWTYKRRTGINWWGGTEVSSADLVAYLNWAIPHAQKEKGFTKAAKFTLTPNAEQVQVVWEEAPSFGPYLLNGLAFFRPAPAAQRSPTGFAYECAGIYRPSLTPTGIVFEPAVGYKLRRPRLLLVNAEQRGSVAGKPAIEFKMAETFPVDPKQRTPAQAAICPALVDLPLLSLVSWNTQAGPMVDVRMRVAMTNLTPRGALLRAGAGHAGDLLSSILPRNHPGYNSQLLVRPFQMSEASAVLDQLGYTRPQGDQDRLGLDRKPLTLRLASLSGQPGLVEKVLADSLMALGIHSQFQAPSRGWQELDGVVAGVFLPWPHMNLMMNFHSMAADAFPFRRLNDKSLDRDLETYALALTQQTPDFQALQRVHAALYGLEPFTVLMQHRACLHLGGGMEASAAAGVDVKDPDWFRKLVI